jgi:oxygen-independent coproporphyrinogen III oxidase
MHALLEDHPDQDLTFSSEASTLALLGRYAATSVPRYTSYPPATLFEAEFAPQRAYAWLSETPADEPVSLYLHVPFCAQQCWYCGCNQKLASRYEPVADFVSVLLNEIDLMASHLPTRRQGKVAVSQIHFGGGTPTILAAADFARLMGKLHEHFDIGADAEVAVEIDPRTISDTLLGEMARSGVNRVSLGVQEFDGRVQAAINRIQPFEMVETLVEKLRANGIAGINFDLMYGLPHQTTQTLQRTILRAISLKPDRISLFGYAHVPWFAKSQRMLPEAALPNPRERADQALQARRTLIQAGYVAIGMDHFARPDDELALAAQTRKLHRNFQGYTTDQARTLIGLGPSSISQTPFGYFQNSAETNAWARAVQAGDLPIKRGLALSEQHKADADLIKQILCEGVVQARTIADIPVIESLEAEGLVSARGEVCELTETGWLLARCVAAKFDPLHVPNLTGRHALAL